MHRPFDPRVLFKCLPDPRVIFGTMAEVRRLWGVASLPSGDCESAGPFRVYALVQRQRREYFGRLGRELSELRLKRLRGRYGNRRKFQAAYRALSAYRHQRTLRGK